MSLNAIALLAVSLDFINFSILDFSLDICWFAVWMVCRNNLMCANHYGDFKCLTLVCMLLDSITVL